MAQILGPKLLSAGSCSAVPPTPSRDDSIWWQTPDNGFASSGFAFET